MLQITKEGHKLVRSATGAKAYRLGTSGTFREWHWKAMVEAWKSRLAGLKSEYGENYGHIGWNTWLRLREYKDWLLIQEYSTWGEYKAQIGCTPQVHWLRLSVLGEQFYRENWQRYRELYPKVDAPKA
jgi:hypothetical protein